MVLLESLTLPMGEVAKEFNLVGCNGKRYSLEDFKDSKILVIIFMCNHCPYVQSVWSRFVNLQEKYKDKRVQFVGINPNKNPEYPEETIDIMAEYYQKYSMNFPYLIDETQEIAKAYKAQCTPDIYVFDDERKLVYHGRLDDSWKDENAVTKMDLDEAISSILGGRNVPEIQYPSMGCSIKWK